MEQVKRIVENDPGVTKLEASRWLGAIGFGLFVFGRLRDSGAISQFKPNLVLAAYAVINLALSAECLGGGKIGMCAIFGTFFFMAILPAIFALGIRGLGDYTKLGSWLIVLPIVGERLPRRSYSTSRTRIPCAPVLWCPSRVLCFITFHGAVWQQLENQDVERK